MDRETLRGEVEAWVRDGIVTEEQAAAILARYDAEEPDPGRSRLVVAVSLVGAALVFAGVTWFLATNWQDLPRWMRAGVLIAAPGLAYAGGVVAYGRTAARVGHALVVLGAVLVGPSIFLFADLLAAAVADVWLWFGWVAVALPTGHALDSRTGTGIGLVVLVGVVVALVDPADPVPVVGMLGVVVFALGYAQVGRAGWTYRAGGAALTIAALLLLTTLEGRFARFTLDFTAALVAGAVGAVGGMAWLYWTGARIESAWAAAGLLALGGSIGVAVLAPDSLPGVVGFAGTHLAALGALVATGYLGYRTRSRVFIDLAAVGALFQTVSFAAATVVDALSGSVALIVAGVVLLGVGLALERGRRSVLARL